MVAKWRLTSAALVSGHRCSAGCSSGEYGGRKSRWTCSGTRRRRTGVPAGTIQDEDDLLLGAGADLAGEVGQFDFEERDAHRGRQMEEGAARGGMDKADQIAPGVAMLHGGERALARRRPDPAQERFEADAVFVGRPQLDLAWGKAVATCRRSGRGFFEGFLLPLRRPAHGAGGARCRLCLRRSR